MLYRMPSYFDRSLAEGNVWMKDVVPQLGQRLASDTAILFPDAMAKYMPLSVETAEERRLDLWGISKH